MATSLGVVPDSDLGGMAQTQSAVNRRQIDQAELNQILSSHERYLAGRGGARAQLKNAMLDGCVLANRNLNEADFTAASLVGANAYGSSFARATFYCTDLRRCNLRNTTLAYADMRGASFKGADLAFAIMDHADLRAATMMMVEQSGVSVIDHVTGGKGFGGVDFSNASLRNASFGKARLDGANFNGALLIGTNFRGAQLKDASFTGAVLMGVNLLELNLPREIFADCLFDPGPEQKARAEMLKARLVAHQVWVATDGKEGESAVVDGEDLRVLTGQFKGRSLIGLSARGAIATAADFSDCQLQGAKFDGADLRGANFAGAELSGASFHGARLSHARFDQARLCNLHLRSGEVLSPNLRDADANSEQFDRAIMDQPLISLGFGEIES